MKDLDTPIAAGKQPLPSDQAVDLASELDGFLAAVNRAQSWRVARQLKSSEFEVTDLVFFVGAAGGELGPFVRKQIDCSAGVGSAYEDLWRTQCSGLVIPGVPRLVECTRQGDHLCVVMEYIEGVQLNHLIAQEGVSFARARTVMEGVCKTVRALHEQITPPLIHRDIKPSNIIMRPSGPMLIDFGIARSWRESAECDTAHFGTRAYAPPEQFGFGQTDARSDVYALGMLLFFCVTGCEPLRHLSLQDLQGASIAAGIVEVISRATALDPDARYQRVSDFASACTHALAAEEGLVPLVVPQEGVYLQTEQNAEASSPQKTHFHMRIDRQLNEYSKTESISRLLAFVAWVWNVVLICSAVIIGIAGVQGIFEPTGSNVGKPMWYLIVLGLGFCVPAVWSLLYLALNRRVLSVHFPIFATRSRWKDAKVLGIFLLASFFVLFVATYLVRR